MKLPPASEVTRDHILQAINEIDSGRKHNFSDSKLHDLVFNEKEYPSKAVYGVACELVTGEQYLPDDFGASYAISRLRANGFTVVSKTGSTADTALFINGVYEEVLEEILMAQEKTPGAAYFLQPYKAVKIRMLEEAAPSIEEPIKLYLSTTRNTNSISYTADITRWENKQELDPERIRILERMIERYQPGELVHFRDSVGPDGKGSLNLISIRNLQRLPNSLSIQVLNKKSDGKPLKDRTRSGGWSEVFELEELVLENTRTETQHRAEIEEAVARSRQDREGREARLEAAPRIPEKVQIVSVGFKRNSDVITAVLDRASGKCELCGNDAPFIRKSDNTPFLEVHHWIPLSENGEDTVENAFALCPNCHREVHYGTTVFKKPSLAPLAR